MATRSFIAIKLAPNLLTAAGELQCRLESQLASRAIRWTKPDQLHLTLWFLGDVEDGKLGQLEAALRGACQGCRPLNLRLERLGCFPSASRPRVIWLGLGGDVAALLTLAERIKRETHSFGEHQEERAFKAHLTIGRLREAPPSELARIGTAVTATQATTMGEWTASSVELMASKLSPSGAQYTQLASIGLQSSGV